MLIDVFLGRDKASATRNGSLHCSRTPHVGEKIEIDGILLVVTEAWHKPDIYYAGAKYAVLASQSVHPDGRVAAVRDEAALVA